MGPALAAIGRASHLDGHWIPASDPNDEPPTPNLLRIRVAGEALLARAMKQAGTKPEMEIFEAGMIDNAMGLLRQGLVEAPLHFDFVMGSKGSQPATARQLVFLSESIPVDATWTVAGLGRHQLTMGILAIGMGGHVRVGLEDNIYYSCLLYTSDAADE